MANEMFCFQCEQTAGGKACTGKAGVCGKTSEVAVKQDKVTGALITLANTLDGREISKETAKLIIEGLFTTVTNVSFDTSSLSNLIDRIHNKTKELQAHRYPTGYRTGTADYDMQKIWQADEDIRSLKSLILFGIRGVAAYAYHAMILGYTDKGVNEFLAKALHNLSQDLSMNELLPIVLEVGEINLKTMAMLEKANTTTYGTPAPKQVSLTVEKGPFIVITGHDLKDLEQLLQQTEGKGINVYTHGEMLPAHAYPELNKYPHLKGNFGTAWQNQQKEFDNAPGAFLYTTNCLMPPKTSYADRVFTTGEVQYPNTIHIAEADVKDFSPVIEKALALGGYTEKQEFTGINGGHTVTTGFGQATILSVADKVIDGVKSGAIKHFFLVAGCDGIRKERSYYTEFVKQAPADTIVLTLACGKYRFNDLDIGEINGIPRLLDMGQCNDAYGAIQVAVALAKAFNCGVNDLPLSMVLSWYEQKAVCILLTLLHLGIKNIKLGPSLPAFLSPNVINFLVENYNIAPITTPEKDMNELLG